MCTFLIPIINYQLLINPPKDFSAIEQRFFIVFILWLCCTALLHAQQANYGSNVAYEHSRPTATVARPAADSMAAGTLSFWPDSAAQNRPYVFAVDSMPDSIKNKKPTYPFVLYRTIFNQARLNYAISEKLPIYAADSAIIEELAADSILQRIGLKVEYDLQPLRPRPHSDAALLCVFLGIMAVFTYVRRSFDNMWPYLFEAFWNPNLARQFYEEYSYQNSLSEWLLTLNGMVVMGMAWFLIIKNYIPVLPLPQDLFMAVTILGVSAIISIKLFSFKLIAWVLPSLADLLRFFRFTCRIILGLSAMLLTPVLLMVAFSPQSIAQPIALLFLVLMLFVLLFIAFRGLLVAKEVIFDNKFHFLVYLCTLEAVPILLLIKLLRNIVVV